jgi:NAD(P)-dependent dehydrogenase (short-subunit alcohol dehydrogenase family)
VDLELEGRTAIVTGGSRGIGKAIARALASEGVDVALVARTQAALDASAGELAQETRRRFLAISADTGKDEDVRRMVSEVLAAFGRIDILVNCAALPGGQAPPPKLAEITDDAQDIAHVVTFLASPKSVAINGEVIAAGGGTPRSIYY